MQTRRTTLLIWLLGPAALTLAGCGSTKHATASGRPEVTIPGKVARPALAEITNEMVNLSYTAKSRSEMGAVFEQPLTRMEASVIGGINPVRRVTYDIVESDTQTRILASFFIVRGVPGRGEEANNVDHTKDSLPWQELLNRVRNKLTAK